MLYSKCVYTMYNSSPHPKNKQTKKNKQNEGKKTKKRNKITPPKQTKTIQKCAVVTFSTILPNLTSHLIKTHVIAPLTA